jgi:hypothetical protein
LRKFVALFISWILATSTLVLGAPASAEIAKPVAEFSSYNAPSAGDFDVVVHRSKSGQHAVLRIKYPQLGQRVQLMRVENSGRYRQVFAYTLTEADLDASGNYSQLPSGQLVRVFSLPSAKTTYQVLVDGKEYLERKTITKTSKALVRINSVIVRGSETAITGNADFSVQVRDLFEGSNLSSICLFVDGSPISPSNVTLARLGNDNVTFDAQGCLKPANGIDESLPLSISYQTRSLMDGRHTLLATASLVDAAGAVRSAEGSLGFITDNQSLRATAPNPTFSGGLIAGQTLTVNPGNWGNGVTYSYKWFLDGVLIRGASSDKYLLTFADVGKVLKAEVTGVRNGQDTAVRTVETTTPISEQGFGSPSQGNLPQSSTAFNVVENANVYDTVLRRNVMKEVNNYNVIISHPTVVLCELQSTFSSCSFKASVGWSGTFDQYESFFETARLVRVSDGAEVATDFIGLSTLSSSSDTLDFTVSSSWLRTSSSLNQFRIQIRDAGTGQVLTSAGSSTIQFIRSPNTSTSSLRLASADSAIRGFQDNFVYRGGTASSPAWKLWQYGMPSRVLVMQSCAILPIFVAPQSLIDGSLDDWSTKSASDVTISVFSGSGQLREKLTVIGSRGDWNTIAAGNQVNLKVCGLNVQKDKRENLRVQLEFRYDAYNFESSLTTSTSIEMVGNMRFTKINCFQGEAGQVINAYKPTCPEGWTQTKAKIRSGKVVMTTLNCLAGRDLKVVRAPEAKCPEGYEVTDLKVRDGKLLPWSISCRKGFDRIRVSAVFPSCPAGYTRTF